MKILFISDNFPPETNAPSSRVYEHCLEWVKLGCQVTVITCFPNFPKGKVYEGYSNKLYSTEIIEGIKVVRVWSYISENKGFLKRTLDFISFGITSFIFGLFQKFDVVIGTTPQFFTAISSCFLSFFKRKPWIMEVRDLWPESIVAVNALSKNSFIYRILNKIELFLYKNANGIIVVTDSFKKYINSYQISNSKIQVIKNGFDMDFVSSKNQDLKNKLGLTNKFLVSYIGTHGMAHGLDFILRCAAKLDDETFHFLFVGDGAEKNNLVNLSATLNLNNVTFIDSVSKEFISDYLLITDVALVNLKKSKLFKTVIPSKIFENIFFNNPILLGVEGESKDLIEKYNVGISYEPENPMSFIKSLKKIKEFKNDKFILNCNKMLLEFNRKTLAKKMLLHIKDFLKE